MWRRKSDQRHYFSNRRGSRSMWFTPSVPQKNVTAIRTVSIISILSFVRLNKVTSFQCLSQHVERIAYSSLTSRYYPSSPRLSCITVFHFWPRKGDEQCHTYRPWIYQTIWEGCKASGGPAENTYPRNSPLIRENLSSSPNISKVLERMSVELFRA